MIMRIEGKLGIMKEVGAESPIGMLLIATEINHKGIHDSLQGRASDHRFADAETASETFGMGDRNNELLDVIARSSIPLSQHEFNFSASQSPAQALSGQLQPDGAGIAPSDHFPAKLARFRQATAG